VAAAGAGYLAAAAAPGLLAPAAAAVVLGGILAVLGGVRPRPSAGPDDSGAAAEPTILWRLRVSVRDAPGRLAQLAGGLAELGGNIRAVHVHPTDDGAVDEILLHTPRRVTAGALRRAVRATGGWGASAVRADVDELDDVPTRAFTLATRLVDGAELSRALRGVLGEIEVQFRDGDEPEDVTADGMLLRAPGGGTLQLRRRQAEFTPAEFARARAMAQLAATCQQRARVSERISAAGEELDLRRGDRSDVDAVERFHAACSRAARSERYAGSPADVRRLLTPALGRALLVLRDGEVVAMGTLACDADLEAGDLGLLVRDDWQRRGIGALLARRLVDEADAAGVGQVRAQTRVHNAAMARTLRAAGLRLGGVAEPGEWSWTRRTGRATGQETQPLCEC